MSKARIKKNVFERCLLTDVVPFETPIIWSNWGSYNYWRTIHNSASSKYLTELLARFCKSIPYNYFYNKTLIKRRQLSVVHPNCSSEIVMLYKTFSLMIIRLCQKSSYSLRRPHSIAKCFTIGKGKGVRNNYIEELNENKAYVSSYFVYLHFSHLHKYYESAGYTALEKKYQFRAHFDISKCFPSIYTHSIEWAIRGKEATKKRIVSVNNDKSFGARFDRFMENINYGETNGIVVGPEFSRIFAEIILQDIDHKIESAMELSKMPLHDKYCCTRYIDDYYVFYNEPGVISKFSTILTEQLEKYKLYVNASKMETIPRPFISSISIKKIKISAYIQDLLNNLEFEKCFGIISSEKEINKIRSIITEDKEENAALTNFIISALTKKLDRLNKLKEAIRSDAIRLVVDLAFYCLHIDIRVSSVYRITKFIIEVKKIASKYPLAEKVKIFDKMFYHLSLALDSSEDANLMIESMNLLIAATE